MSITVAIEHVTTYDYDRPVRPNPHLIRLRPTAHCRTPILSYSLRISPADHYLHWQQDPYNNWVARMNFERGRAVNQLRFQVEVIAEMIKVNPFDFRIDASAATYPFTYEEQLARELSVYREVSPADAASPLVQHLADEVWANDIRTVDHIVEVNRRVNQRLGQGYTIRLETGVQSPHETLQRGRGSCRDFAWLMCILLRRLGYAARFVSGYSVQLVPDLDDPLFRLSRDVVDLHAWTEVYLPGAGWVGLDATNGALCEAGHIPLAATADPGQAAPITGSFSFDARPGHPDDQVEAKAQFSVTVTRLAEAPRVTRPYSPQQWEAIDAAGLQIDTQLSEMDVRLTMGGEPTFVALDDMDAPEWNIAAVGPTKRLYAGDLLRRLHERFTNSQGLMFFGQGKWYPGESLPRWSLSCWWRSDGQPVWQDPTLTADERAPGTHDRQAAERLMAAITTRLGVEAKAALPGYEDVWYYLHRERRLPVNVDPLEARLDDPQERRRLAEVLRQGLGQVVGYALPLRRLRGPFAGTAGGWQTGRWFLRDEHLYLMPGDSPMGFRLPLDSLPWQPPDEIETYGPVDPFAPRDPLPPPGGRRLGLGEDPRRAIDPSRWPGPGDPRPQFPGLVDPARRRRGVGSGPESEWESLDQPWYATVTDPFAGEVIRTALCVEPRRGHLYVFVPPQRCAEDFLDLIAAIEQAAADTALPVFIEGYEPPGDPRLRHFRITPDPGVIEVNIHPSADWGDLREKTRILYQEARAVGLGTEKFMLDGRHAGTGGGNHVTLGGATAADSPILRRPDVLASLVTYWNHHPSLSYLFSTLFVGPTSQSPRLDEARHDSLHELEIALRQLPNVASTARDGAGSVGTPPPPPWLVDRLFRHLLVDLTGNTHRAEFCIDKLYSPDGPAGRHGLLEMRAFEMPPHWQMSLAQQLLLRAAVARFWRAPYRRELVRWGAELHDRFMLPHFVWQDFRDVLADFADHGCPLPAEWFAPHWEFRFPKIGNLSCRDVRLELRTAIEPWHVLGEELSTTGTARYVDSSLERIEVKVSAMTDPRHVVTANGRALPLHPTGVNGEFVAGVRFRAWQPPSCLHPTIRPHVPLVLDVVDTWSGRSVGGCTYHVSHPDGRNSERFPVNAFEAEARRRARFWSYGHTPGPMTVKVEGLNREAPFTLDLRR